MGKSIGLQKHTQSKWPNSLHAKNDLCEVLFSAKPAFPHSTVFRRSSWRFLPLGYSALDCRIVAALAHGTVRILLILDVPEASIVTQRTSF